MKKKIWFWIIGMLLFLLVGTFLINNYMIKTVENRIVNINDISNYHDIDAILVLGCKAYSDGPSLMLSYRLDKGEEIYQLLNTKLILSGDHGTEKYDEVNVMRDYILEKGIDRKDIFLDHAGFTTYDSIYRAKYVFNAKKIVIVTQKYHLYRALYIAHALNIDAIGVEANEIPYKSIMLKNEIREIFSRDKNFIKCILKPKSKYLGEMISLEEDGAITNG